MGVFRRVEADQAGPMALGILIPPSRRTFVILRPRSLPIDLLLCRGQADLLFHSLSHDEASACAQASYRGLRDGLARIETTPDEGDRLRLLAHVGPYVFGACSRVEGQPYALLAESHAEAETIVAALTAILCPAGEQEVYFNTRFFERSTS